MQWSRNRIGKSPGMCLLSRPVEVVRLREPATINITSNTRTTSIMYIITGLVVVVVLVD